MINTSPTEFWFFQPPSDAQVLVLLPFASHSFSPTSPNTQEETQYGPLYWETHLISSWCSVFKHMFLVMRWGVMVLHKGSGLHHQSVYRGATHSWDTLIESIEHEGI